MNELKMGADPSDFVDNLNALHYIINGIVNQVNTIELVKVVSVDTTNKKIDVTPIVKNVNAENKPIEESIIYGIRYIQWQYGINGIIATPAVGDIGLIVICKKDISQAETGLVGSLRKYCLCDGIYIGGVFGMNTAPTQFIEFTQTGISITSQTKIDVTAPTVNVNASTSATVTSPSIDLGSSGGSGVARIGDTVVAGGVVVGTIATGSSIVKAV